MALNLLINGRVLTVNQPEPWTMPEDLAEALGDQARQERAQGWDRRGAEAPRPLARDVILALLEGGRLRTEQARAGVEVRMVYEAVTSVVAARTARYGETGCQGLSNADWPPSLKSAAQRYSAWSEWAKDLRINPRYNLVELVQDVAIDGLGLSQVRARRGIHDVTALRWLQKGLWQYAFMAGWLSGQTEAA